MPITQVASFVGGSNTFTANGNVAHDITVSGATANNLLVCVAVTRAQNNSVYSMTAPTGWTLETSVSSASGEKNTAGLYSRVASGTSADDFSIDFTGSENCRSGALILEYTGNDATSPVEDSANDGNFTTSVTSRGTGTATPVNANGVAVATLAVAVWTGWDGGYSDTLGLSYDATNPDYSTGGAGRPGVIQGYATYTSAVGKTNTWSTTDTGEAAVGLILVAKEPAGGATPVGVLGGRLLYGPMRGPLG